MLERDHEPIRRALQALAEDMADKQAPPRVEARLRAAFRQRQARPVWSRWWWLAAAAALLLAAGLTLSRKQPPPQARASPPASVPASVPAVAPEAPPAAKAPVVARRPKRQNRQISPSPLGLREVATEFIPVNGGVLPFDRGRLMRVRLPRSAIGALGLPFDEDRAAQTVKADVLVGEDGMLRAVRFVQ